MNSGKRQKTIKEIKVDINRCTGCRSCEMACSAFHAIPKYSSVNPSRSRIRVFRDEVNDNYVPIRAGGYIQAECNGRSMYVIDDKKYSECVFCPASCPSRNYFKEPDSGLPLKCDMCENNPPLEEPMCVTACRFDALTYIERTEQFMDEYFKYDELETACRMLVKKYGKTRVIDAFKRFSGK